MIFPMIPANEWKDRYGIVTPKSVKCDNCGKRMTFSVPVAYETYRGLKTPDHGCPENFDQYVDVPVDPNEINLLKELVTLYKPYAPSTCD